MEEQKTKLDVGVGSAVKAGVGGAIGVGLAGLILPIAFAIGTLVVCCGCMFIGMMGGATVPTEQVSE
jgi:hypothetical protein